MSLFLSRHDQEDITNVARGVDDSLLKLRKRLDSTETPSESRTSLQPEPSFSDSKIGRKLNKYFPSPDERPDDLIEQPEIADAEEMQVIEALDSEIKNDEFDYCELKRNEAVDTLLQTELMQNVGNSESEYSQKLWGRMKLPVASERQVRAMIKRNIG